MSKNLELQDLRKSQVAETNSLPSSNVDELHQEISVRFIYCDIFVLLIYVQANLWSLLSKDVGMYLPYLLNCIVLLIALSLWE